MFFAIVSEKVLKCDVKIPEIKDSTSHSNFEMNEEKQFPVKITKLIVRKNKINR